MLQAELYNHCKRIVTGEESELYNGQARLQVFRLYFAAKHFVPAVDSRESSLLEVEEK